MYEHKSNKTTKIAFYFLKTRLKSKDDLVSILCSDFTPWGSCGRGEELC